MESDTQFVPLVHTILLSANYEQIQNQFTHCCDSCIDYLRHKISDKMFFFVWLHLKNINIYDHKWLITFVSVCHFPLFEEEPIFVTQNILWWKRNLVMFMAIRVLSSAILIAK